MATNRKVMILGACGCAGRAFTRCVKSHYLTIGMDTIQYALPFAETFSIHHTTNEAYKHTLIGKIKPDLLHAQPDEEVLWINTHYPTKTYGTPLNVIEDCQDKLHTLRAIENGVPTEIATDINIAKMTPPLWLRANKGAGGKLGFKAETLEQAFMWREKHEKEDLIVSPYIKGDNVSCDLLYHKGHLHGALVKKRISYSLNHINHEGGGQSAIAEILPNESWFVAMAGRAVRVMNKDKPHGVFGVDFKDDLITEVNPARFLTGSLVIFDLSGYNLPLLYTQLALGDKLTPLGEYPLGKTMLRTTDALPKLI